MGSLNKFYNNFGDVCRYPDHSPLDIEEHEKQLVEINRRLVSALCLAFIILIAVFWPTDFIIFDKSSKYFKPLFIWRIVGLSSFVTVYLLLRYSEYFKNNPVHAFIGGMILGLLGTGYSVSIAGGVENPFFYGIYPMPMMTIVIMVNFPLRVFTSFLLPLCFMIGAAISDPSIFNNPFVWTPIVYVFCIAVGSIAIGHAFFRLTRINFLQQRQLVKLNNNLEQSVFERTSELNHANILLRNLASNLCSIQEQERTRISRDLHDELGQLLTGMRLNYQTIENQIEPVIGENDLLKRILTDARNTIDLIHVAAERAISSLRPSVLDTEGLVEALNELVENYRKQQGIEYKLFCSIDNELLSATKSMALYRIIQESLTNISKHSRAENVEINCRQENGKVIIGIKDDGIGFDRTTESFVPGLGLNSIEERVRLLQGDLQIISNSGKGTIIAIGFSVTELAEK
jgi:signal transduction histidine kinase